MEIVVATPKEQKPKVGLFHISHSLFKNKRLKRRLAVGNRRKSKKRQKGKATKNINGRFAPQITEVVELISTDEEEEVERNATQEVLQTSIVLSSDDEDEKETQNRIFPMRISKTTVQTEVGNTIYELSLTQLKENLDTMTNEERRVSLPSNKRLSNTAAVSADVSISLLSDDEED